MRVKCPSCSTRIQVKAPTRPSSAHAKAAPEFDLANSRFQPIATTPYLANQAIARPKVKHPGRIANKIAIITGATAMVALLAVASVFVTSYTRTSDEQSVSPEIIVEDSVGLQGIGWETVIVGPCRAKFPPGNAPSRNTTVKNGVTSTMLIDFRRETDSQYSIIVMSADTEEAILTPDKFAESLNVSLTNLRPVQRNGANGIAAKVETGNRMLPRDTEIEILRKGNTLVVANYQPYSATRVPERDKLIPKPNERELDRPEDFFASLTIL